MSHELFSQVDDHLFTTLIGEDPILDSVLERNALEGLPPIDVSPLQGKFLTMLAQLTNAKRVLELGTLGGYSSICFARGTGKAGKVVTLELNEHHANTARKNYERAGISDQVELMLGPAMESLDRLISDKAEPFDIVFIDADKANMPGYYLKSMQLIKSGSVIIGDNVVRGGRVLEMDSGNPDVDGVREFLEIVGEDSRVDATALQLVGKKDHDGFSLIRVK